MLPCAAARKGDAACFFILGRTTGGCQIIGGGGVGDWGMSQCIYSPTHMYISTDSNSFPPPRTLRAGLAAAPTAFP